jgi:sulfite reductase (NADPH) hemoprotein beta-component
VPDELEDPRPWCEIIRQWSTFHPEFTYLPRKFKIAVTGAPQDRAASLVHDIGVHIVRGPDGDWASRSGRRRSRPHAHHRPGGAEFLPREHLLSYLEAILRIYNREGRRDNLTQGAHQDSGEVARHRGIRRRVEAEWESIRDGGARRASRRSSACAAFSRRRPIAACSRTPPRGTGGGISRLVPLQHARAQDAGLPRVYISLKKPDVAPGDATDAQMELIADLADRYSFGEVRVTHTQNLLFGDVEQDKTFELWQTSSHTRGWRRRTSAR